MPRLRSYAPLPIASSDTRKREVALRRVLRRHRFLWRKEWVNGAVRYSIEPVKPPTAKANAIRERPIWLSLASAEDLARNLARRAQASTARERREDAADDGRGIGI